MPGSIVITGIGIITPLGASPHALLDRITRGDCAAAVPEDFSTGAFACPLCARVQGFRPQDHIREPKLARLMNRDAQFAVAAARLALEDPAVATDAAELHRRQESLDAARAKIAALFARWEKLDAKRG